MKDKVLLGLGRHMIPIPGAWLQRRAVAREKKAGAALSFMSEEHHRVRDFVVTELPRVGEPLSPETIAAGVGLAASRVRSLVDELEKHLTFLFRVDGENVSWAYPVTVEKTPHRARFSTGEDAYSP